MPPQGAQTPDFPSSVERWHDDCCTTVVMARNHTRLLHGGSDRRQSDRYLALAMALLLAGGALSSWAAFADEAGSSTGCAPRSGGAAGETAVPMTAPVDCARPTQDDRSANPAAPDRAPRPQLRGPRPGKPGTTIVRDDLRRLLA
jgi:hypothetical protein